MPSDAIREDPEIGVSTFWLGLYATTFFLCMVVQELAVEAASTRYSELDCLTSAVTLFQFGFCVALPAVIEGPRQVLKTFPRNIKEFAPYIRLSLAVFGATALSTHSLYFVSYPTKVAFKSAKLIPVMIVATIMNSASKYGPLDYLSAFLLCAGAAGYSYGSGKGGNDNSTSVIGIFLLSMSILCDAIVPNMQAKLMAPSDPPPYSALPTTTRSPSTIITSGRSSMRSCCDWFTGSSSSGRGLGLTAAELMVNVNAVGTIGLFVYMILSGSLLKAISTSLKSPMLLMYLTMIGLSLSAGVLAYTKLIKGAGSVVAVTVATLRKVATIVLSYVFFPKPILRIHVYSGLLILGGIVLNAYTKNRKKT